MVDRKFENRINILRLTSTKNLHMYKLLYYKMLHGTMYTILYVLYLLTYKTVNIRTIKYKAIITNVNHFPQEKNVYYKTRVCLGSMFFRPWSFDFPFVYMGTSATRKLLDLVPISYILIRDLQMLCKCHR